MKKLAMFALVLVTGLVLALAGCSKEESNNAPGSPRKHATTAPSEKATTMPTSAEKSV